MWNASRKQDERLAMISRAFWILFFLTCARDSLADTEHIFRIEALHARHVDNQQEQKYDSRNESAALFPREFTLLREAIDTISNDVCQDRCRFVLNGLRNLTGWAAKFYDASGKIPTGLLAGSVYQLGNFDECLELGLDDGAPQDIRGQYCLGEVDVGVPEIYLARNGSVWEAFRDTKARYQDPLRKLYWGICVPAGCAAEDLQEAARRILDTVLNDSRLILTVKLSEMSCYENESEPVNAWDIIYICVILFVLSLILSGTILHAVCLKKKKTANGMLAKILITFSLILNLEKLFGPTQEEYASLYLDCVSGIKFIFMFLILIGHSIIFIMSGPMLNKKFFEEVVNKFEGSIFLNSPLFVDTFLFLSSFLFCTILLQQLDKRKSVNFLLLYIARYIRLTPAYFMIIGLYATWLTRLDSGPLWFKMRYEKEKCLTSWWTNILYINNYVNTDKLCMFQSWYLAVDTQLFILAPIIIYPLWRWRKIGECLLVGATVISMAILFLITLLNNLDPTIMIYLRELKDIAVNDYFRSSYIKTHMRAVSYCVGLIYGYIAYRIQTGNYKLSKRIVKFGWLFAILSLLVSMFSITTFYSVRKNFTVIEAAIYSPLHRFIWCAGVGWIIIACITDNAGRLKNFLKSRVFTILSRLTYSAYLVNGIIVLHTVATMRSPQRLTNFTLFYVIFSHIILTFGGAILLSMMFESPILSFQRMFMRFEISKSNRNGNANISNTQCA